MLSHNGVKPNVWCGFFGNNFIYHGDRSSEVQVVYSPAAMEESTGIVASLPAEASSSTASTTSAIPMTTTTDPLSFPAQNNNMETYQNTPGQAEGEVPSSERVIPIPELKAMLRQQLEYYFSRENLATDAYLRSQMDGDQYVPITTISRFNQIRRLTEDFNLVVEALRESPYVQVDEAGEKVRPSQRSIVLILREIPESTPIKDLEELFSGENCPKFSRCEFAHNDTWYVLFETDEDAKKAYCYLREEAKTFHGKPIMARIKASLTSAPYSHKNGVCTPQTTEAYNAQQMPQQQAQMQYTYANVPPNETYNNQQICPPFYPPTMLQAWAPATAACVDLGAVFSMNGLSPQTAYRPLPSTNKASYPVRERQVKAFSPQQSHVNRNEQSSSRYFSRSQSSYLARQQQQPTFHSLMNSNACSYDYMPYPSGSRNLHSFGCDVNFFTTSPGVIFRKFQNHSSYGGHAAQVRHSPLLLPRNQVGVSAINSQDQSYIPMGSAMPFPKDAVTGSVSSISKQNSDAQGKENWGVNQKQRSKRWSKENGTGSSGRPFSENSNGFFSNKGVNGSDIKPESPKFDLEANSFPPLPGCLDDNILGGGVDVYESRLSDIVKGTVKPSTRDTKTQTSESGVPSCALMKDSSTFTIEEPVTNSDGAFTPPTSSVVSDSISNADQMLSNKKTEDWETYPAVTNSETLNDQSIGNSISTVDQTSNEDTATTVYSSPMNTVATNTPPIVSLPTANSVVLPPASASTVSAVFESETVTNVPNDAEKQSVAAKLPKVKQPDPLPKVKLSEVQSPKSKTPPEAPISKSKIDSSSASKENKAPLPPKPQRAANLQNKQLESSLNKEKLVESMPPVSAIDIGVPKTTDAFSPKDKVNQLHPAKARFLESSKSSKGPDTESSMSFLSVNGHADSESSMSSEDEKPFRKLTYSEVAMRAKDKVEKLAQELKEKERQEALVRHHRQQEIVAQGKQGITRGPFREFSRRVVSDRPPGSRDWRERRKPARTASLPSTGQ